jgi:hypothetical protein
MELKKITVTTTAGQAVSFHVNKDNELWVDTEDLFIFKKLSGNEISFYKGNVVSIDVNDVENNQEALSTT